MRKQKTIHYLYKTTCKVTGRYYIGMHSTSNIDDGYLGSGKRLRYSIRKYGKENHEREILELFESRGILIEAEKKAITSDLIQDKNCMNLMSGGQGGGGFALFSKDKLKEIQKRTGESHNKKMQEDSEFAIEWLKKQKAGVSKAHKDGKYLKNYYSWVGKEHSSETKIKMSVSSKGIGLGEANSQYGTCWVTNGIENKKIKNDDINFWVNNNWKLGRTSTKNSSISKETIKQIKILYFQLKSMIKVAKELKIAKSTVQKYLKNDYEKDI